MIDVIEGRLAGGQSLIIQSGILSIQETCLVP